MAQYLLITLQINKKLTVTDHYYWFYLPIMVIEVLAIIYCLIKLIWVQASKEWKITGRS